MLEVFLEFNYSWTFEHFEERNFSMRRFLVLYVHVVQIYLFYGVLLIVYYIPTKSDLTCRALTERAKLFVFSQACQLVGLCQTLWRATVFHLFLKSPALLTPDRLDKIICGAKFYTR